MATPKPGDYPHPDVHIVSSGYTNVLGVKLLRGRAFEESDNENAPHAAMINAMVAQKFFPHEDPVGKRFMFGHPSASNASAKPPQWWTIVGVVADTRLYGFDNPARLEVYLPYRQSVRGHMKLLVKSRMEPEALTSAIRSTVASIDKEQPIFEIATMEQLVTQSVLTRRLTLILLGLFGGLALVLAAIGIYGVIAYSVAQRSHEIGIRMALGAARGDVVGMVLAEGARLAGAGIVIGVAASFALMRLLARLLFSVSAADPTTFLAVAAGVVGIAMLACYIPARRTVKVDPMVALRNE